MFVLTLAARRPRTRLTRPGVAPVTAHGSGRLAARNLMGAAQPYDHVSSFFSDLFDISYDFLGDPPKAGQANEIVRRGSLEEGSFAALYLGEGYLQAAFIMGRPKERHPLEELIRRQVYLGPGRDRLSDPRFPLDELVS